MSLNQTSVENETPRFTVGVQSLIAMNAAIYYLRLVGILGSLESPLGFTAAGLGQRWWTVATYMFVHAGFWHLVANMYALYLFGPRLEEAWGSKRFVRFFMFCGIVGAIAHALFVRDGSAMTGSSAAVFGVMIAYAIQWPTDEVFFFGVFPMRAWTTVWSLLAVNLGLGLYAADTPGSLHFAYLAHAAGAVAGWVFMRTPGAPSLEQLRQRVSRIPDVEDSPRPIPKSQPRTREKDDTDEVVQRSRAMLARRAPVRNSVSKVRETRGDDLNRVLDKISAEGIESLTVDERQTLEEVARRLRGS